MNERPAASNGNQPKCSANRKDGTPCQAAARPGKRFCWAHDPSLNEQRDQARRTGGANRSTVARARKAGPSGIAALMNTLEQALADLLAGNLDARQASAAASLARAIVAIHQAGEMELRLRELERALAAADGVKQWPA